MCLDCDEFINKGDRILDFGCGSGIIAKAFQQHFNSEVVGVDIKDDRTTDIPFKLIKNNKIDFNDLNFDVILISYVLHHTKDPEAILKEIKRIGKRIIVYEDLPEGFFSKIVCFFHEISYKLLFQPEEQSLAIKYHHYPSQSEDIDLAYILHMADFIAMRSGICTGADCELYQLEDGTMEFLGLQEKDIDGIQGEVVESVEDVMSEMH